MKYIAGWEFYNFQLGQQCVHGSLEKRKYGMFWGKDIRVTAALLSTD